MTGSWREIEIQNDTEMVNMYVQEQSLDYHGFERDLFFV